MPTHTSNGGSGEAQMQAGVLLQQEYAGLPSGACMFFVKQEGRSCHGRAASVTAGSLKGRRGLARSPGQSRSWALVRAH